jgi:DNA excision repair protein ERCC-4
MPKYKDMLRIIVDERERTSGVGDELRSLGVMVEYRVLDIADYIVGEYAVERKSIRDFVSSLYSGRLFDQGYRLGEAYQTRLLLIEGDFWKTLGRQNNPRSIWGAVISAVLDFGLNIFFTPDSEQTAQFLYTLAIGERHASETHSAPIIVRKPRSRDMKYVQLSVLSSLPNVGPRVAKQLLDHFGSLRKVFEANTTDMAIGARIGRARALALTKLFDYETSSKTSRSQVSLAE